MTKQSPEPKRDLRVELIDAGLSILSHDGLSGLTLRACAAKVGVSHAAPAYHFDGLPGLRAAIAARGYECFAQMMEDARAKAVPAPRSQLVAICEGYLAFAAKHPSLFSLIFSEALDECKDADLEKQSRRSYEILEQACAPFAPVSPREKSTEAMVWSLVHGLACLSSGGQINGPSKGPLMRIDDILPPLTLK